jgi:hypothetical protein
MLSATTAAAGIAAIALTGSVLLNGLTPPPPANDRLPAIGAEAATAAATREPTVTEALTENTAAEVETDPDTVRLRIPETVPDELESGVIDTPEGPARWVRWTGAAGEVPRPERLHPWADGLANWTTGWTISSTASSKPEPQLWVTSDGTDWRQVALPASLQLWRGGNSTQPMLSHVSGTHFLIQPRTHDVWRRADDGVWVPLDTSAVTELRPEGWGAWTTSEGARLVGDDVVFDFEYRYRLPRQRLGIPREDSTMNMHQVGKLKYALCPRRNKTCSEEGAKLVVRFKPTPDGLVVRNDRNGKRYGLLAGAKASELYEGYATSSRQSFVLDGGALVPVRADEPAQRLDPRTPPPGLPANAYPERIGPGWVASEWPERRGDGPVRRWLYLGGEWRDLSELGFPDHEPYSTEWSQAGLGNTTLLWFEDPERDESSLWTITAPAGS